MINKSESEATSLLLNINGRARLTLMGILAVLLLASGFLVLMQNPAQAWPSKISAGKSCMASGCHRNAAGTIEIGVSGTKMTTPSVTVAAGGTFELDWRYTAQATAGNADSGSMIAVPTNWTVQPGTANSPTGFTSWNTVWDAAGGVSNGYSLNYTMSDLASTPNGYAIDYTGSNWHNQNGTAMDYGQTGGPPRDQDGIANLMGSDARVTVPTTAAPGSTYTVAVMAAGHNGSQKSYVTQSVAVTVIPAVTSTSPNGMAQGATGNVVITGAGFTNTSLSSNFGSGITVNSTTYNSATQVTANITVSGAATLGTRNVSVTCSGQSGTGTGVFTVTGGLTATTTTVSNPSAINYGQTASFTATVNPSAATGTVQFKVDGVNVGSPATLSGGTASISGVSGLTAGNRSVTAVYSGDASYATSTSSAVTQTVNKATLTVTANNASKSYGSVNPALTVAYSGFVGSDTAASLTTQPTATTTAVTGSPATTYPITASGGVSSNYNFNYVAGVLTVNPVVLTVTADDKTKTQGSANPALTVSYSGFVNSDTATNLTTQPTASTTATTGSPVGTYPITASGGVSSNYTFNYVAGTLTVSAKLTQTITFGALTAKTYGAADYAPGATATSGLTVTYASSNPAVATIVGGNIHIVGAGSTNITASQAGNATYDPATDVIQPLTVNKANPSVTTWPTATAITYGQTLASSTLSGGASTPAGTFAFTTPATAPAAGTAAQGVTFTPTDTANYNTTTGTANVTVGKANQTIGAITFTPTSLAVSGTTTASATATSSLTVSFSSDTPSICTVSGNVVTGVSAGTCTIRAAQAGDSNFNAAPGVTQPLTVTGASSSTVTVTLAGTGDGTVNSTPSGIACPGDCSEAFSGGTEVTLMATPDWKSDFIGWTVGCSGTGTTCIFTPSGDTGVTATFNYKPLVMMPGPLYYATIQDAYNACVDGTVLQGRDQTFSEDLVFDRTVNVTFNGGNNAAWTVVGNTTIHGTVTMGGVAGGSVIISNMIIQ